MKIKERILDKIKEIEKYCDELSAIVPATLEEYKKDLEAKAACERYLEKIVEAMIDIVLMIIKLKKLEMPKDDKNAIDILEKATIIDTEMSRRLQSAKGMRNFLIHLYDQVNDELVFESVSNEINKDAKKFIAEIKKNLGL